MSFNRLMFYFLKENEEITLPSSYNDRRTKLVLEYLSSWNYIDTDNLDYVMFFYN